MTYGLPIVMIWGGTLSTAYALMSAAIKAATARPIVANTNHPVRSARRFVFLSVLARTVVALVIAAALFSARSVSALRLKSRISVAVMIAVQVHGCCRHQQRRPRWSCP